MGDVQIPLDQVASVEITQGAMAVKTENAFQVTTIFVDNGERDVGGYVKDAQELVNRELSLPPGYTLVWVGFIALAGVAAETAVIMLIYLDEAYHSRNLEGRMREASDVAAGVREGALERLRPVVMTVTAITMGLAPILWSGGTGADVMKRIAAPMVGGMVSATVLTLVVVPAIYLLWRRRQLKHRQGGFVSVAAAIGPTKEERTER